MKMRYSPSDLSSIEAPALLGIEVIFAAFGYILVAWTGLVVALILGFILVHGWFKLVAQSEQFSLTENEYMAKHGVIFKRSTVINLSDVNQLKVSKTRGGVRLSLKGKTSNNSIFITASEKADFKTWAANRGVDWNESLI